MKCPICDSLFVEGKCPQCDDIAKRLGAEDSDKGDMGEFFTEMGEDIIEGFGEVGEGIMGTIESMGDVIGDLLD